MIIKATFVYGGDVQYDTDVLEKKHGPAIDSGYGKLWLINEPCMENRIGDVGYTANAVDANCIYYRVYWDLLPDWSSTDNDDESEACDWEHPRKIEIQG